VTGEARYATGPATRAAAHTSTRTDNVFGNDGGVLQLGTVTGSVTSGYAVSLAARVDTRTSPTGGGPAPSR
jgi:hypothetical protein